MAKRQNFVVGSTNAVTETMTTSELNHGFDRYEILTADKLDGTLNSVSDYSNDSSNEIANAIQSITGAQPTGATQTELANALQQMRNEIETTSLTFKGYVATSAPSSSTYALVEGNLWINSATMPTSFPVAASSIKQWNGTSWVNYGSSYTPADFDFFRNINDNEGYYWFGGIWTVMSTDMSTTYFTLNQSTGKWEIKSSVNLPGSPTTTTPDGADQSTKIATTQFAHNFGQRYVSNCITQIPQNINLTLASGAITLKAGSKVYIPNGSGVFDEVVIENDISQSSPAIVRSGSLLTLNPNKTSISLWKPEDCYSGTTAPTSIGTNAVWYDTANNVIKLTHDGGSTWVSGVSLPFGTASSTATAWTSIDQIFNGFGFIGASVFALPGVKGVIPNGRNADGTLKNTEFTLSNVLVTTDSSGATGALEFYLNNSEIYRSNVGTNTYNEALNIITNSSGVQQNVISLDTNAYRTNGAVTSFNPKFAFHAVDYSDFKNADDKNAKINETRPFIAIQSMKDTEHAMGTYNSDAWHSAYLTFNDSTGTRVARVQGRFIAGTNIFELGLYAGDECIRIRSNGVAYAPANSGNNTILTTSAHSNQANGYYKLGNGLIIQWGVNDRSSSNTVNLPTAFSSGDSYHVAFGGRGAHRYGWTTNKTSTGFTFDTADDSTLNNSGTMSWIAIGY